MTTACSLHRICGNCFSFILCVGCRERQSWERQGGIRIPIPEDNEGPGCRERQPSPTGDIHRARSSLSFKVRERLSEYIEFVLNENRTNQSSCYVVMQHGGSGCIEEKTFHDLNLARGYFSSLDWRTEVGLYRVDALGEEITEVAFRAGEEQEGQFHSTPQVRITDCSTPAAPHGNSSNRQISKERLEKCRQLLTCIDEDADYTLRVGRLTRCGKQLKGSSVVKPPQWGISLGQLKEFFEWSKHHQGFSPGMTVREFVKKIIEPSFIDGQSVSLAFRPPMQPNTVKWLVSHCWDEDACEFLQDVIDQAEHNKIDPIDGIFICFLCLFQGSEEELRAQVTQGVPDIQKGCFAHVLASVKMQNGAIWVVPSERLANTGQGLYQRLWVGWEAYQGKELNVPLQIHPRRNTSRHLFGTAVETFSLKSGTCGDPHKPTIVDTENEKSIRLAIENGLGWAKVDAKVKIALLNGGPDQADLFLFAKDADFNVHSAAILRLNELFVRRELSEQSAKQFIDVLCSGKVVLTPAAAKMLVGMGEKGVVALARMMYCDNAESQHAARDALRSALSDQPECDFFAHRQTTPTPCATPRPSVSSNVDAESQDARRDSLRSALSDQPECVLFGHRQSTPTPRASVSSNADEHEDPSFQ